MQRRHAGNQRHQDQPNLNGSRQIVEHYCSDFSQALISAVTTSHAIITATASIIASIRFAALLRDAPVAARAGIDQRDFVEQAAAPAHQRDDVTVAAHIVTVVTE